MILIIDNYDSFVYTLAGYVTTLGFAVDVCRNDSLSVQDIEDLSPEAIIISPGPCTPSEAGICVDLVRKLGNHIPMLGVCLGHQAIGEAYGGQIVKAPKPVHGKTSAIHHDGSALFRNVLSPFDAARYHSLVIQLGQDSPMTVTAHTDDNIIMAVQHKEHPVYGVQFHPESILSAHGMDVLENFLYGARDWNKRQGRT